MEQFVMRTCSKCGEEKFATLEYFHKHKKGLRSYCKSCALLIQRNWWKNHPEKAREKNRKKKQRQRANKSKEQKVRTSEQKAYMCNYYRKNKERIRAQQLEWERTYPEKVAAKKQRRRARKLALPANFTTEQWNTALEFFNYRCAICEVDNETMCADHWIPLDWENCPGTVVWNILPLCRSCNSSKLNRHAKEWLCSKYDTEMVDRILSRIAKYFTTLFA